MSIGKNLAASAVLVLACLTGCQNTVNTVENAEKTMQQNNIQDKRFVTDGFLRGRLALKGITTSRTPDGFMRAQLEVMNMRTGVFAQAWSGITGENPYKIRYKFTWFTRDGMMVESVLSDWQTAVIIPGESLFLQSVAPDKNCYDFRIELKEANN